tara:strand:- start:29 stop:847 length:819 start_codon:yes stop_codon:yes gene_type:complete
MSKITTILSLGAGVQSSTLALMAARGEFEPMPDVAIFADTGYEPKAVYKWLEWLEKQLPFPVKKVSRGNLRDDQIKTRVRAKNRAAALPYFTLDNDTKKVGMLQRQCTAEYKIQPVTKYTRQEILGLKFRQRAPKEHVIDLWYGISYDEIQRMKVPFVEPWRRNVYPLIEKRIRRGDCLEWMEKNNFPKPPRSACLCCPFHSEKEWLNLKNGDKNEWKDIVDFDKSIRRLGGVKGDLFLHRSCKPIDEVDFFTLENAGQMSLLDECEGMCGI